MSRRNYKWVIDLFRLDLYSITVCFYEDIFHRGSWLRRYNSSFQNPKGLPGSPPSLPSPTTHTVTMDRGKLDSEETSVLKDRAFQRWADERLSPSQSLWKKQPMKISSTVQFREPYKSILVSTHISVWGEFICLITERRCRALALLITVRYMNGGESPDSAGQKGGQSN